MTFTYADILDRLEVIEGDIAKRQDGAENAAREYFQGKRDFEHAWATEYVKTEGTVEERRQRTIIALYRSEPYKKLVTAEANYEAQKAVMRALETRASIGQSLLRASQREAPQQGQQPEWSSNRQYMQREAA